MLSLIRDSGTFKSYDNYYNAIPFTIDPAKQDKSENDSMKISGLLRNTQVCFVECIKLITTKNKNLMPFVLSSESTQSRSPIFNAVQLEEYCESKLSLLVVTDNLSTWLTHTILAMPSCSLMVLDFSQKTTMPPKSDIEDNTSLSQMYTREDLANATSRTYVKITKSALSRLQDQLIDVKYKSQTPLKIIAHFGGSHYTMHILTIYSNVNKTLSFDAIDSYYISPSDIKNNQWMQRYTYTPDTASFFCDLMNRQDMSKWNKFTLIGSQDVELPPLIRFLVEVNVSRGICFIQFRENGHTIVTDVVGIKDIAVSIMAKEYKMKGTVSDYLSDIYAMEVISKYYSDFESMMSDYTRVRLDSPIFSVKWTSLNITASDEKIGSMASKVKDNMDDLTGAIHQMALVCFMSDMDFLTSPQMRLSEWSFYNRKKMFNNCITNIRVWMIQYMALDEVAKGTWDPKLSKHVCFLTLPIALLTILPKLKRLYGDTITSIKDIVEFIRRSDCPESIRVRDILTHKEFVQDIFQYNKEMYMNEVGPDDESDFDTDFSAIDFNEDCDQLQQLEDLLNTYDESFVRSFREINNRGKIRSHIATAEAHNELIAPFYSEMTKRRVEYLVKEGIIDVEGEHFTFHTSVNSNDLSTISNSIKQCLNYQVVRRLPTAWSYWTGVSTEVSDASRNTLLEDARRLMAPNTPPNSLIEVSESSLKYRRKLHQMYTWKQFPLSIRDSTAKLLSSKNRSIDESNMLWRMLKYTISEYTVDVPDELPHKTFFYTIKLSAGNMQLEGSTSIVYIWFINQPTVQEMQSNFSVLVPILLTGIFCLPIPPEWLQRTDITGLNQTIQTFPFISQDDIEQVLRLNPFSSFTNFSIYDLYTFLSTMTRVNAMLTDGSVNAGLAISVLVNEMIYRIGAESIDPDAIRDMDEDDYTELITDVSKALIPWVKVLDNMRQIFGTPNSRLLIVLVKRYLEACEITPEANTGKVIHFMVRIMEIFCDMWNQMLTDSGKSYLQCMEFMFDVYQPLFSYKDTDATYGKLIYRLYELDPDTPTDNFQYPAHWSQDFDGQEIIIPSSKGTSSGLGPTETVEIIDPLDGKKYLCLSWNCDKYLEKNQLVKPEYPFNTTSRSMEQILWQQVEFEAARWITNRPRLRSKIHARSKGVEWNGCRWALWLQNAYQSSRLDVIKNVNLAQIFLSRFKTFSVKSTQKWKPAGDLISKEFGELHSSEFARYVIPSFMQNINFLFDDLAGPDIIQFTSPLGAHGVEEGNMTFASLKKTTNESRYETIDRRNGWEERSNLKWSKLPWYKVDNFVDISLDKTVGFGACKNITYVYLPRHYDVEIYDTEQHDAVKFSQNPTQRLMYHPGTKSDIEGEDFYINHSDYKFNDREILTDFITIGSREILSDTSILDKGDHVSKAAHIVLNFLPLFGDIFYVFLCYRSVKRYMYRIDEVTEEERRVPVNEYNEDYTLNKESGYYYRTGLDMNDVEDVRVLFQGVYGNECKRRDLYYLFTNALVTLRQVVEREEEVKVVYSTLYDYTHFYISRYLRFFGKYSEFDSQSNQYKDPLKLLLDHKTYSEIPDMQVADNENCKIFYHYYGFYGTSWVLKFMTTFSEWFVTSQVSSRIIPDVSDNASQLHSDMVELETGLLYSVAKWPFGNGSIRIPDIVFVDNELMPESMESALFDTFVGDFCKFVYQVQLGLQSYKTGRQMELSLFLFLSTVASYIEMYKFYLKYEAENSFSVRSKAFIRKVLNTIWDGSRYGINSFVFDWHEISTFMTELQESSGFVYATDTSSMETIINSPTELIKAVDDKYHAVIPGLDEDVQLFEHDLIRVTPQIFKYLFLTEDEVKNQKDIAELPEKVDRPKIMKAIIKAIESGGKKYYTTERDYGELGIHVDSAVVDSNILWESIESILNENQMAFFIDPSVMNRRLDDQEEKILKLHGAAKIQAQKGLDKMKEELRLGRVVMMWILDHPDVYNPTEDPSFYMMIYNLEMSNRKDIKAGSEPVRFTNVGANKFDIEYNLRKLMDKRLSDYALALVFGGRYETINDKSKTPKKNVMSKFDNALTMYIPKNKAKEFKPLVKDTLLESLLLAVIFNSMAPRIQRNYYLEYKTSDVIVSEYRDIPTVRYFTNTDSGPIDIPLMGVIDMSKVSDIFADTTLPIMDKLRSFFEKIIEPITDLNISILEFLIKGDKFILRRAEIFENKKHDKGPTIYLMLMNIRLAQNNKVSFFEPLFVLEGIQAKHQIPYSNLEKK